MERKEFVAMLMESPFYFDLQPRERLLLVQQHHQRFSLKAGAGNAARLLKAAPDRPPAETPLKCPPL